MIVGFAAETGDEQGTVLDHGRAKLARKGCDLLVVNEVGEARTFGQDHNTVHILRQGSSHVVDAGPASKADELTKLAALRDQGILTGSEFETQKAALLA